MRGSASCKELAGRSSAASLPRGRRDSPGRRPWSPPPKKGNKEINKEINYFSQFFLGDVFPEKLGLDAILGSWDLKIRIPRRKLRIWSYSQVETRPERG